MADQIKMMKDQLKMPSMQKHMHNPQMRHRGKFSKKLKVKEQNLL